MDLATSYLGLSLPHPLIVGASPLTNDLDFAKRLEECRLLGAWVHDFLRTAPDKDLVVAGDFNDTLGSPALETFAEKSGCRPLTAEIRREYSNRKYRVLLDHIFVSPDVAKSRLGSVRVVHLEWFFSPAELEKISDHDPVIADFKTQ
jgi:endonuclease/exonuclease/phosphatase family metal-dependent hydrolase